MTTSNIKIGDFVEAQYKFGCVSGMVKKVLKNKVIVSQHTQNHSTFTDLKKDLNITIERIFKINAPGNSYN